MSNFFMHLLLTFLFPRRLHLLSAACRLLELFLVSGGQAVKYVSVVLLLST